MTATKTPPDHFPDATKMIAALEDDVKAIRDALSEFNRRFTSANSVDVGPRVSVPTAEWRDLRTRLLAHIDAQALPAAEPVAWAVAGEVTNWARDFSKYRTQHYVRPVYTAPHAAQQAAQATAGWPASLTTAALKQSGATMESAAAHLESLPKMHQGKLLAHDLRRAASCCETAIESIQQATQPQAARTTEGI